MNVLVIGSGGREHALVWKINQSPLVKKLVAAPGNAGMEDEAECRQVAANDPQALLKLCKDEKIDLAVVGPEQPLVNGITDLFKENGITVFGPARNAAQLEGSKVFSKKWMLDCGIPTSRPLFMGPARDTVSFLKSKNLWQYVIKADGLAGGKGVVVVNDAAAANEVISDLEQGKFVNANGQFLVEELISGDELSILAFTDGKNVVPLASSQDHKRVFDHDKGPNTGGMGAYSPCPWVDDDAVRSYADIAIRPLIHGLAKKGIHYRGLIYAGIMLTEDGPYVLEYNVRFGDPEAEAVIPRLDEDIVPLFVDAARGEFKRETLKWKKESVVTVVMASGGYPGHYETGFPIEGLDKLKNDKSVMVFHAGTKTDGDGHVVTAGGRVLDVTAYGSNFAEARKRAYDAVGRISFEKCFYRTDIGARAMLEKDGVV